MYITREERTGLLIEAIHDLAELVEQKHISGENAFLMVRKWAERHPDYPKLEVPKNAELDATLKSLETDAPKE